MATIIEPHNYSVGDDSELLTAITTPLPNCDRDFPELLGCLTPPAADLDNLYHATKTPLPDDNDEDFPENPPLSEGVAGGTRSAQDLENPNFNITPTDMSADTSSKPDVSRDTTPSTRTIAVPPSLADPIQEDIISVRESVDEVDKAAAIPLPEDELEPSMLFERFTGMTSPEEFKTIFTDIITHHHLAHTRDGTLYGGALSPNQVMFMRNKKTRQVAGMLADCDPLLPTEPVLRKYHDDNVSLKFPAQLGLPRILYRHDLESIVYIFLWIIYRFNFRDDMSGLAIKAGSQSYVKTDVFLILHGVTFMETSFPLLRRWLIMMLKFLVDEWKADGVTFETFKKAIDACLPQSYGEKEPKTSSTVSQSSDNDKVSDSSAPSCNDAPMEELVNN